ncbi:MAG: hypothetical protein N2Z65_05865, partial [Clostridiales bacterium]|nr:hypothetical protein [Clostridiales bacterium]
MEGEEQVISWLRKYDILNKALCLLAAVLLWFYVVSVQNPEKSTEINNISVNLIGEDQLVAKYGLAVVEGNHPTISLKITGRREKIAQVTPDKIVVSANLETINSPGVYAIQYQPSVLVDGVSITGR